MAATASTMLELGTQAPDFLLPDVVTGRALSLGSFQNKRALVVMFLCHHCPFVKHVKTELARLGDEQVPDDSPDGLKQMVSEWGLHFPVLYDESQEVAKKYAAACTPDFFLFDAGRRLVYRGQLDDSRPSNGKPVTGADLRAAMDAVLAGRAVSGEQRPSLGCNIKWRAGNEPAYYHTAIVA